MWLTKLAPKKFLCRWDLRTGCKIFGIFMCCLMVSCTIATVVQTLSIKQCDSCKEYSWGNAYSFSITSVLYCVIMLIINIWFLWGIKKQKASVILSWVVVTATWIAQSACLLIVLLCLYSAEANVIVWIISVIFSLIAFCILIYGLLLGYGYWLQLKTKSNIDTEVNTVK